MRKQKKELKQIVFILALAIISGMWTGCKTKSHITSLPKPEEFKKPLPQLKQEYNDLTNYESSRILASVFDMPEAQTLIEYWGEPQRKGFCPLMLWPPYWILHPTNYWFWEYEGKLVKVTVDRPLAFGYKPHVWKMKVREKKK